MSGSQEQIQLFRGYLSEGVRWRLLSGNNREIARSAATFDDEIACRRAVRLAQSRLPNLTTMLRRVDLQRWAWEVRLDGQPLAVSGHSFDRQIRCRLALEQFVAAFADARIRPTVIVSGARRWERA